MDAPVLTAQEANDIEKILLQSPNASIKIVKSPYGDQLILVQSDAVGEVSGSSLAEAIANFRDHLLNAAPEVADVPEETED